MTADDLRSRVTSRVQRIILDRLIAAESPVCTDELRIAVYGRDHSGGSVKVIVQRLREVIRPLGWDIPAENHGRRFKDYRLVRTI